MRGRGTLLAGLLLFCLPARAQENAPRPPELGLWMSGDRGGVFSIGHCGQTLCGRLIGLDYDNGDVPKDWRGKSECGLLMLTDFTPGKDGRWSGHILDPRSGKIYQSLIWMDGPNVLKLRGYILGITLLGQTETWTRYTGRPPGPECKFKPPPAP